MTTPELAAKWGIEPSELQDAFDFLVAHHLSFVVVIAKAALRAADPAATVVVATELETAAASTIGVSPATIALILQIIQAAYPVIAQILSVFLGSLAAPPAPPAPPKSSRVGVLATVILLLTAICAGPAAAGCSTTKKECPPAAKAAMALSLSLERNVVLVSMRKETTQSVVTFRDNHHYICAGGYCARCSDAVSAALREGERSHTPVVVWVQTAADWSVDPAACHLSDSLCSGAQPGVVVFSWSNGGYRLVPIPPGPAGVTRDRIRAATGARAELPGGAPCQGEACHR